ncbi:MAG: hypothetical protein IT578_11770 [Verrucomicrobiae bacterium]|nr:hypothetical protein [Verrucomicrobiae bacterium]
MNVPPARSIALALLEGVAAAMPDDLDALRALAEQYTEEGFFTEGLDADRKLVKRLPKDPLVLYNYACSLTLTNNLDDALAALKESVHLGYSDFEHLLKDKDLASLRRTAAFRQWLDEIMA